MRKLNHKSTRPRKYERFFKETNPYVEKAFLCVAILKHGPQSLPYSSHQDTGSMPSPGIWALWLEDQWNMAEVMQHGCQARALRNGELLFSVPWNNGPGLEPRVQAVRKFRPHAEICVDVQASSPSADLADSVNEQTYEWRSLQLILAQPPYDHTAWQSRNQNPWLSPANLQNHKRW